MYANVKFCHLYTENSRESSLKIEERKPFLKCSQTRTIIMHITDAKQTASFTSNNKRSHADT
jgi:hypothetical protein